MCSEGASLGLRFHPLGNPYWPPWLPNPLQPVEIKDVFPAAGDQTPARVQALLGRALPSDHSHPDFGRKSTRFTLWKSFRAPEKVLARNFT